MKNLLVILISGSFITLAIFGVFGMHTGMQDHGSDCIMAIAQGIDCPNQFNQAGYLTFHLDALKNISVATPISFATSLLLLSLLAIGIAFGAPPGNLAPQKFAYLLLKRPDSFNPPLRYELAHWLALHENSPATH